MAREMKCSSVMAFRSRFKLTCENTPELGKIWTFEKKYNKKKV